MKIQKAEKLWDHILLKGLFMEATGYNCPELVLIVCLKKDQTYLLKQSRWEQVKFNLRWRKDIQLFQNSCAFEVWSRSVVTYDYLQTFNN